MNRYIPFSFKEYYPRPIMYRDSFISLNGNWDFCFGKKSSRFNMTINVPYAYNTEESGLNIKTIHKYVNYRKKFTYVRKPDKSLYINFEGIDYNSDLYCNGYYVCKMVGGYHRHSGNLTKYLVDGENEIIVRCHDSLSPTQMRGKQRILPFNYLCFYKETTGIYKDVWLEEVPLVHILSIKTTSQLDSKKFIVDIKSTLDSGTFKGKLLYHGKEVCASSSDTGILEFKLNDCDLHISDVLSSELYDIEVEYIYGDITDKIYSYTGFRKLETIGNKIFYNNKPIYQKLVLDQGYKKSSQYTLPYEIIKKDIDLSISLGFNGARKHQKIEDERYYAYADICGFLVWAEGPSMFVNNKKSRYSFMYEWGNIVSQISSYPSIITFTAFNESWGIFRVSKSKKIQDFLHKIYNLTKRESTGQFVLTNDGWEHTYSDFLTIHNYHQKSHLLKGELDSAIGDNLVHFMKGREFVCDGYSYDKPIILSEFGGTAIKNESIKNWGYGSDCANIKEYLERLNDLFMVPLNDSRICGYCYTQLTDVEQEINGILSFDHEPKINVEELYKIQNE